jgi:Flp pilus assembly protein TadD
VVEEDDYEPESSGRRGLMLVGAALALLAVAGVAVVMTTGDKKPVSTVAQPVATGMLPPLVKPVATAVKATPTTATPATATPTTTPTATTPTATVTVKPAVDEAQYQALLAQGKALYNKGQSRKAMIPLEKAVAIKATGDDALVVLANCHLDRGDFDKALAAAELAVAANGENADGYVVIGAVQQHKIHNSVAGAAFVKDLKLAPKGQFAGDVRSILGSLH